MSSISWNDGAGQTYYVDTTIAGKENNNINVSGSTFKISATGAIRMNSAYSSQARRYVINPAIVINGNHSGKVVQATTSYVGNNVSTPYTSNEQSLNTSAYFNSSNKTSRTTPVSLYLSRESPYNSMVIVEYSNGDSGYSIGNFVLDTANLVLNAPPSCSYTQASDTSGRATWTQNMSVARTTISNATAQYGGNISSAKLIVGNASAEISGNGNIDVLVTDSGVLTPQVIITDSRGQETTYTLNPITVVAYNKPSIESIELSRHIPSGSQDETQCYIQATINQSTITGNSMGVPRVYVGGNEITNKITWYNEASHTTQYTSTTAASKTIYGVVDASEVFATGNTYTFSFTISDAYSTSESKTEVLPSIFITMDFKAGGKEIAFGGKADDDLTNHTKGLFRCDMDFIATRMVGEIKMWAGATIPNGWILCDGSTFSSNDYPVLASVLGDSWGEHSGTTYYLPNLNGRTPVGYDASDTDFDTVGDNGGEKEHTLTVEEMPSHNHDINKTTPYGIPYNNTAGARSGTQGSVYYGETYTPFWIGNRGGGESHNNMQPYAVVKYIICAY